MDDRVVRLQLGLEKRDIIRDVHGGGMAELAGFAHVFVYFLGDDVDAVAERFLAAHDVERRDVDAVLLAQRGGQIAGAVRRNLDVQGESSPSNAHC